MSTGPVPSNTPLYLQCAHETWNNHLGFVLIPHALHFLSLLIVQSAQELVVLDDCPRRQLEHLPTTKSNTPGESILLQLEHMFWRVVWSSVKVATTTRCLTTNLCWTWSSDMKSLPLTTSPLSALLLKSSEERHSDGTPSSMTSSQHLSYNVASSSLVPRTCKPTRRACLLNRILPIKVVRVWLLSDLRREVSWGTLRGEPQTARAGAPWRW